MLAARIDNIIGIRDAGKVFQRLPENPIEGQNDADVIW